tara:strand:+ start:196 stop:1368 length:1173 start_codon:yes stop_codon:yes gene_type:complete
MTLFEKLKNKRYTLSEQPGDLSPEGKKNLKKYDQNIRITDKKQKEFLTNLAKQTKAAKDGKSGTIDVGGTTVTNKQIRQGITTPPADQGQFRRKANRVVDRPLKKTIPGKSKKVTVSALDKRDASIEKLDKITVNPKTGDADKTKKLISDIQKNITQPKKGEKGRARKIVKKFVDTKAQDYTDEINKQNKNRPEGQKRTYYKGRKAERTVYTDGSTRDQRVAKIKADIDKQSALKTQQKSFNKKLKTDRLKQRTIQKKLRIDKAIAKSGESSIKFRDTARTIAKKFAPLTKTITTSAVTNKAGKIITPSKTKQALKPVVKKGIQFVQKAGPGGAIAAGSALALLNPSIRKTAKRVAKAALGATGLKAFAQKPKLVKRPPSKIGINLSPKT